MAGRTKSFLGNTTASLLLMLVTLVTGFLVPRSIIGCYGSAVNGLVTSLTQFISYISLVEAGISAAAVFALYVPLAKHDLPQISVIVSAARRFYYKSGFIFVALVAVLAFAYPLVVDCEGMSNVQVAVLVFCLGASGFLDFFTLAKYRVLLTASQRNWAIQYASILYKLLYAAVIVALAHAGVDVVWVYVAAILPIILRTLILSLYTRHLFPDVDFSASGGKNFKLNQRWDAFYLQVLGAVQSGIPTILATFLLQDLSMVSVFAVYMLVANGVQKLCASFSNGTQASFGDVIARGQAETLKRTFREFQALVYGLSALCCGIAFVAIEPFIALYTAGVADMNYNYPLIGFLAILNVLLYHLKTPQGLLVISAGKYRETRVQTTVQALILVVFGTVFGLMWGVPGILVGACLSNIYRDIDLAFFIPRTVTHTRPAETFAFMAASVFECALVVLPFAFLDVSCAGWAQWVLLCCAVAAWGLAVVAAGTWLFHREQFRGLLARAKRMLKRG